MATKLRNFSRNATVKAISFILCIAGVMTGLLAVVYFEVHSRANPWVSTFDLNLQDFLENRSFMESRYLAYEASGRFIGAKEASGWYAETAESAELAYTDWIDSLNNTKDIYYYIKTPYRTVHNTQAPPFFFENHKVWLIFEYGQIQSAYFSNSGTDYSDLFVRTDPDSGGVWDDFMQDTNRYTAYFCLTDEAVDKFEGVYAAGMELAQKCFFILIFSVFLALLCFVHLLFVCSRKPNSNETHLLPLIDKPWLDVSLSLFLLVIGLFAENVSYWDFYTASSPLLVLDGLALAAFFGLCLCWILSAVKHLKNRTFLRHTLIGFVCIKVFGWLFRTVRGIISHWRVTVQMGFYAGIISFFSAMLVFFFVVACESPELGLLFAIFYPLAFSFAAAKWAVPLSKVAGGLQKLREGDYSEKLPETGSGFVCQMSRDYNRAGEGLQSAVETAMRSERFKAELISNVSHDLRTPLTSVITYADLLRSEGLDAPDAPHYVEIIAQKAKRLSDLTDDLFEASKAASGEMKVELQPLDLSQLLSQALGEMNERLNTARLDVRLSGAAPHVMADGKMMWRVFENLLGNIIKYSLPGSRVYIDTSVGMDLVTVTLRNISEEPLSLGADVLTERFTRGDEARASEGSGLGLAIVKSFMELQKGGFALTTDGDLFKVTVSLPLCPPAATDSAAPSL